MRVNGEGDDCGADLTPGGAEPLVLTVSIREMTDDDIGEVLHIEFLSSPSPWRREAFYAELCDSHSIAWVAEHEGDIVAYICGSLVIDEGHILNVSVHPLYRRRGVARTLVEQMLSHLAGRGCTKAFLEVRESNVPARAMYRSVAFVELSRRRDYYRNPVEDAIVMVRHLARPS